MPGTHKIGDHKFPRMDHAQMYEPTNMKPDYIDLDKDGDKKESMKKAAQDKKAKEAKVSGGGPSKIGSKEKFSEGNFPTAYHTKMMGSPLYYGNKKD